MKNKIEISIQKKVNKEYLELVRNIFFKIKGRCGDLEQYFPFIFSDEGNENYFLAYTNRKLIGGLTISWRQYTSGSNTINIGLVGLVCVDDAYRGIGVSTELLNSVIKYSTESNCDGLSLWTSKHRVYEKVGFELCDNTVYGDIRLPSPQVAFDYKITENIFPIPTFAKKMIKIECENSFVKVAFDKNGPILCDWEGDFYVVLKIISSYFDSGFRINARKDDKVYCELVRRSIFNDLKNNSLNMWLPLNSKLSASILCGICNLNVLDRI